MTEHLPSYHFSPQTANERRQHIMDALPTIDTMFHSFAEQRRVPGLAWGIVLDGELIDVRAHGIQNISTGTPVTTNSDFRIASMSKSFTAMAVLHLRDAGKLQLDAPVVDYVPEFAAFGSPTHDSAPITVRDLLTMNAGFPQDDPWADRRLALTRTEFSDLMHAGISFSNPPGLTFEYSNYGYGVLGRVVTNVSSMSYQEYITRNILQPLGMVDTTFDLAKVPPERFAIGHRWQDNAWEVETPLSDGEFGAMGGLFTTIPDFVCYMALLLSAFPPRNDPDNGVVRRSSLREMQRIWRHVAVYSARLNPTLPAFTETLGYGYGLMCGVDSITGQTVSHGGGLPGYGSYYRLLPQAGVGLVAFCNLTYAAPFGRLIEALQLLQKAESLPVRKLAPTPALEQARDGITALYKQWDDERAATLCTDTFFMDMSAERRRAQFEKLQADLGKVLSVSEIEPENWLRGRWTLHCERGTLEIFTTLAPTVPPRVQFVALTAAVVPSARLRHTLRKLVRLSAAWNAADFRRLFAPHVPRQVIQAQFVALHAQYGRLQPTKLIECDGSSFARYLLQGERGSIELRFALDPVSGKVREISLQAPRGVNFVP